MVRKITFGLPIKPVRSSVSGGSSFQQSLEDRQKAEEDYRTRLSEYNSQLSLIKRAEKLIFKGKAFAASGDPELEPIVRKLLKGGFKSSDEKAAIRRMIYSIPHYQEGFTRVPTVPTALERFEKKIPEVQQQRQRFESTFGKEVTSGISSLQKPAKGIPRLLTIAEARLPNQIQPRIGLGRIETPVADPNVIRRATSSFKEDVKFIAGLPSMASNIAAKVYAEQEAQLAAEGRWTISDIGTPLGRKETIQVEKVTPLTNKELENLSFGGLNELVKRKEKELNFKARTEIKKAESKFDNKLQKDIAFIVEDYNDGKINKSQAESKLKLIEKDFSDKIEKEVSPKIDISSKEMQSYIDAVAKKQRKVRAAVLSPIVFGEGFIFGLGLKGAGKAATVTAKGLLGSGEAARLATSFGFTALIASQTPAIISQFKKDPEAFILENAPFLLGTTLGLGIRPKLPKKAAKKLLEITKREGLKLLRDKRAQSGGGSKKAKKAKKAEQKLVQRNKKSFDIDIEEQFKILKEYGTKQEIKTQTERVRDSIMRSELSPKEKLEAISIFRELLYDLDILKPVTINLKPVQKQVLKAARPEAKPGVLRSRIFEPPKFRETARPEVLKSKIFELPKVSNFKKQKILNLQREIEEVNRRIKVSKGSTMEVQLLEAKRIKLTNQLAMQKSTAKKSIFERQVAPSNIIEAQRSKQNQMFNAKQQSASLERQILLVKQQSKQATSQFIKQSLLQKQKLLQVQLAKQKSLTKQLNKQLTKQITRQITKQKLRQVTLQESKLKSTFRYAEGIRGKRPRRPFRPIKPFGFVFPPKPGKGKKKRLISKEAIGGGYNVYGKPEKSKAFRKLNVVPITKSHAKDLGAFLVDRSLSAQFRVKQTKQQPKKPVIKVPLNYFNKNVNKFREFRRRKGTKILTTNNWIEKRGKRLDTREEVRRITLAKKLAEVRKNSYTKLKSVSIFRKNVKRKRK